MNNTIVATSWKVKIDGTKRSIQLFDIEGNTISESVNSVWSGNFDCSNKYKTKGYGQYPKVLWRYSH